MIPTRTLKPSEFHKLKNEQVLISRCEQPVALFNRGCIRILLNTCQYLENGEIKYLSNSEIMELVQKPNITPSRFRYIRNQIQADNKILFKYHAITPDGTLYPMFILVGCGKCRSCRNKKTKDLQIRATCESITADTEPLSVLLTYNPHSLPFDGLQKTDVQKFLKRLRYHLHDKFRDKGYKDNLRYFVVGEYGEKRQRPHYHLILWNFPRFADNRLLNYKQIKDFLDYIWQLGYTSVQYTCDSRNPKGKADVARGVKYYVKYLGKSSEIPKYKYTYFDDDEMTYKTKYKDCNPTFVLYSRGRGVNSGLGSLWLHEHKQDLLDVDLQGQYIWTYNGDSIKGAIPAYFRDKLAPTISRLVPKDIRDKFITFQQSIPLLRIFDDSDMLGNIDTNKLIEDMFAKFWFMPAFEHTYIYDINIDILREVISALVNYVVPPTITLALLQFRDNLTQSNYDRMLNSEYQILHNQTLTEYWEIYHNKPIKYNIQLDEQ